MRFKHAGLLLLVAGCSTTTPQALPQPLQTGDAAPVTEGGGGGTDAAAPPGDAQVSGPWAPDPGFESIFDGKTFANWDRYLGIPNGESTPLGIDNDPRGVFSVVTVDGEPAFRITGEVWGAIISKKELSKFELRLEFKWGTKVWPPLNFFDSGVMVHSTGALGAVNAGGPTLSNPIGSGAFMVSMEYQLVPGNVGALYNLGPIDKVDGAGSILPEKVGTWNKMGIVSRGTSGEHYLDGKLVASASGYTLRMPNQPAVPLDRGKIQLQSEGGEIYFRRIQIKSLE